ncbi:DUF1501 domain-containing protein [Pendulispora brunnea]|uniref:DUF1501 domain-containing protein n=1 Tax=Pendulispora brunnea TaxID=2905690 RepID=A0ABZ2K000_9BACT
MMPIARAVPSIHLAALGDYDVDRPIDDTGTDHNPFTNSILFAGKGIRAGAVLGGSDFQSSNEELSGAHLSLDTEKLKRMGLPVDFETGLITGEKPAEYTANAYLTIASVVNAVYTLFRVDRQHHWENGRGLGPAPVLAALLKG